MFVQKAKTLLLAVFSYRFRSIPLGCIYDAVRYSCRNESRAAQPTGLPVSETRLEVGRVAAGRWVVRAAALHPRQAGSAANGSDCVTNFLAQSSVRTLCENEVVRRASRNHMASYVPVCCKLCASLYEKRIPAKCEAVPVVVCEPANVCERHADNRVNAPNMCCHVVIMRLEYFRALESVGLSA